MLKRNCLEVAQKKTEKRVYPNLSSTTSLGFTQVYSEICFLQAKNSGWVVANSIFFPSKFCRSHVSSTLLNFSLWWEHISSLLVAFICIEFPFQQKEHSMPKPFKVIPSTWTTFSYVRFDISTYPGLPIDTLDRELSNPLEISSFQIFLSIKTHVFLTNFRIY